jgi:radical SAM protein with 4Fe4S-binding SPASM domain
MTTLINNAIVFAEYVRFMENNNDVLIINGFSGSWGIIDRAILDKINFCINNKIPPSKYICDFNNDSDKQQLIETFEALIEEKMIKSPNEEVKIDIKSVEFKLTNKCNLKCIHCAGSSDISYQDVLTTEQMKAILDEIFKMNIEKLSLTGGEPLIRKDIKELLSYIRKNFKGSVSLTTNGTMIDEEMAYILKGSVNNISISLDGYDEKSTEFVRGKGSYAKVVKAIHYLKEVGFVKDTISLSMTCTQQNFNHKDDFYQLCEKLGVSGLVRQFSAMGRGLLNYENIGIKDYLLYNPEYNDDVETIRENLKCAIFCRAGIGKIMIDEFGDVYPCLVLNNEEYKLGNILTQNFDDVFTSPQYRTFIEKNLTDCMVDKISKCKDCTVRYFCMSKCRGENASYYENGEICEERCRQLKPYLTKVLWEG